MTQEPEPDFETQAALPPNGLEDLARHLAWAHILGREGEAENLVHQLENLEALLLRAQHRYSSLADQKMEVPSGAEWLLDNFYLVQQVIHQVRQDLPDGFYRQLPVLAKAGLPRIYVLASELASASELHVDPDAVRRFARAYQMTVPLTIGELWALPAMLRLAVLRRLGQAVEGLLDPTRAGAGQAEGGEGEPAGVEPPLIAACILDLRAIDIEDWKTVFEDVSRVEQVLRQDPAEVYPRMDFETRDRYRKVIERLAKASGVLEEIVAQQAVDLAAGDRQRRAEGLRPITPERPRSHLRPVSWPLGWRKPSGGRAPQAAEAEAATLFAERTGHVGFYLLDRGIQALEAALRYAPPAATRLRRWLGAHALWGYLGSLFALTLLGLAGLAILTLALGGTTLQVVVVLLVGLVPAITVAVGLVHAVVPRLVPPHRLLKMEFQDGIPSECTTLVAIPALLTSARGCGWAGSASAGS
ncbi:MAG: hypothetical protein NTU91_12900 [Chloroflexi bacterium]|nr:hypothetical protein [Chloroflexota bacterium]